MPFDLGRRLIASGAALPEQVEAALFLSVVRGIPFPRALVDRGAISERKLEEELGRLGGLALRHVIAVPELVARLPRAMCRRLAALPTRQDPPTGTIDVAAADPLDPHIAEEFGFHLGAPIRVLRAPMTAIEEAIRRLELSDSTLQPVPLNRPRRKTPPSPHGAPTSTNVPRPGQSSGADPAFALNRPRRKTPPSPHGAPASTNVARPVPDVPIPLVRRAATAQPPVAGLMNEPRTQRGPSAGAAAAEEPLPLRHSKVHTAKPPEARPAALREADVPPPAVSFPSTPPPSSEAAVSPRIQLAAPAAERILAAPPKPVAPAHPAAGAKQARSAQAPDAGAPESRPIREPGEPEHTLARTLADEDAVLSALGNAETLDQVVALALRGLRLSARRVAVFAVKRDGFQGWACNAELGEGEALRHVKIPLNQPSIFATAAVTNVYLGPIPNTPAHAELLKVMKSAGADVAAVAVRAAGRPAMVLVADDLTDTMTGTRRMDELARHIGVALSRLIGAKG